MNLVTLVLHLGLLQAADIQLPKGPVAIRAGEIQDRVAGSTQRLFVFSKTNPALMSLRAADITNRDSVISELPAGVKVGATSLFQMRRDQNSDFIFTDESRTRVYGGSLSGGIPYVNPVACGTFQQVSDLHISESAAGTTFRVLVADRKANAVYSYTFNAAAVGTPCTLSATLSVTQPEWIRSYTQPNPRIFIGYRASTGLEVRYYQNTDLTALAAATPISTYSRATFGTPFHELDSEDIFVPVVDTSLGVDQIVHFDAIDVVPTTTTFPICRKPDQIMRDFEGVSRWRYIFCTSARRIQVYDAADNYLGNLPVGSNPVKMLVTSNGVNRLAAIMQGNGSVLLHRWAVGATNLQNLGIITSTLISYAQPLSDIGHFGLLDQAVVVSQNGNFISFIDLATQAISSTIHYPMAVNSLAVQSSSISHFVSTDANSAYTLTENGTLNWTLRQYPVGTSPVQIGYRTNRLYALNRGSGNLSVVNLGTNAVTNYAAQTRPIHFDFNTTVDRLWAVNETSQSVTTFNITVGAEAIVSNTALGFAPKKILYQSSDTTLYVAGGTTVRALNAPNLATVITNTLPAAFNEMALITGGVALSSAMDQSLHAMTRTTFVRSALTSSPHLLTSSQSLAVAGQLNENKLTTSGALTHTRPAYFGRMLSTLTNLITYQPYERAIRFYPYGLLSATTFPSVTLPVSLDPQTSASDTLGNLWLADSSSLKLERIDANLQRRTLSNKVLNRPENVGVWTAVNRMYVLLRNLNAVAVVNLLTQAVAHVSVCQSPSSIAVDSTNSKAFILCPDSNAISVLTLNGTGDVTAQTVLETDLRPTSMVLNAARSRLYVTNKDSDNVIVYNTVTNAITFRLTVSNEPVAIVLNPANDRLYVFHENSEDMRTVLATFGPEAYNVSTTTNTFVAGLSQAVFNTGSTQYFAISPSQKYVYTPTIFLQSGTFTSTVEIPYRISAGAAQQKTYVTFPYDDVIRIYASGTSTQREVSVGDFPSYAYPYDSQTKVFVSNTAANSVSVINATTDAVAATVALSSTSCGPTRMVGANVGGTDYLYILCQDNDSIEWLNAATNVLQTAFSLRVP